MTTASIDQALASLQTIWDYEYTSNTSIQLSAYAKLPQIPSARLKDSEIPSSSPTRRRPSASETTAALDASKSKGEKTILYLAYGSNLAAETFLGRRGIKPLSATNVHVPSLDLTFDLPGIPYTEPCFANTSYRRVPQLPFPPTKPWSESSEKEEHSYLNCEDRSLDYHKLRWPKGLVGVVYEVSVEDYRTIVATEGGGASYQDIVVPCFALPTGINIVPTIPSTVPFMAHTLYCPALNPRPDPDYAQASPRYLALITSGACEHELPLEYVRYLKGLRGYTITTSRQKIGRAIFLVLFMPMLAFLLTLSKVFADEEGKLPRWLAVILATIFAVIWKAYDLFFKRLFGDGERTIDKDVDYGEMS